MNNYPRDEFDNIRHSSARQGAHRGTMERPTSGAIPIVALAAVALLIGAIAFLVVPRLFTKPANQNVAPISSTEASSSAQPEQPTAPTADTTPSGTSTASQSPSAPVAVDKTIPVAVYNASGVSGLAAQKTEALAGDGWTVSTTGNWSGTPPQSSVVYYQTEARKVSAEQVARVLGISTVTLSAEVQEPLVVVLGPDSQ